MKEIKKEDMEIFNVINRATSYCSPIVMIGDTPLEQGYQKINEIMTMPLEFDAVAQYAAYNFVNENRSDYDYWNSNNICNDMESSFNAIVENYVINNVTELVASNFIGYIGCLVKELPSGNDMGYGLSFFANPELFKFNIYNDVRASIEYFLSLKMTNRSVPGKDDYKLVYLADDSKYMYASSVRNELNFGRIYSDIESIFEKYIYNNMIQLIAHGEFMGFFKAIFFDDNEVEDDTEYDAQFMYSYCSAFLREKAVKYLSNIRYGLQHINQNIVNMYNSKPVDILDDYTCREPWNRVLYKGDIYDTKQKGSDQGF